MNQTYEDHKGYGWEGSYAYSLIVGGFLHYISKHNFHPTLEGQAKYPSQFLRRENSWI